MRGSTLIAKLSFDRFYTCSVDVRKAVSRSPKFTRLTAKDGLSEKPQTALLVFTVPFYPFPRRLSTVFLYFLTKNGFFFIKLRQELFRFFVRFAKAIYPFRAAKQNFPNDRTFPR